MSWLPRSKMGFPITGGYRRFSLGVLIVDIQPRVDSGFGQPDATSKIQRTGAIFWVVAFEVVEGCKQ